MTFDALLENPRVFSFSQRLNPLTVRIYRDLLKTYVVRDDLASVLDIGCGVGVHRPLFGSARYTGIDINPAYVAMANQRYGGGFHVMDAANLDFEAGAFDAVFTAATCHHLNDRSVERLVVQATRLVRSGGAVHIIDPVLPVSPRAVLKRVLFEHDGGRHQRTLHQLTGLVARCGRLECVDVTAGVLHDVCYIRLSS